MVAFIHEQRIKVDQLAICFRSLVNITSPEPSFGGSFHSQISLAWAFLQLRCCFLHVAFLNVRDTKMSIGNLSVVQVNI